MSRNDEFIRGVFHEGQPVHPDDYDDLGAKDMYGNPTYLNASNRMSHEAVLNPQHRLRRTVDAPSLAGDDTHYAIGKHESRESKVTEDYARRNGFKNQADMRGEDY